MVSYPQRPSAHDLLQHPFLELGNDLDDLPVYGDAELIAAAVAAATAIRPTGAGADAAAAANGICNKPPPLSTSCHAATAASAAASGSSNRMPDGIAFDSPPPADSKISPWSSSSPIGTGRDGSYAGSCSTGSPSPLTPPPAAPSFGGVPTTPSSTTSSHYYPDLVGNSGGGCQHEVLPAGVTPTAYANAIAIASTMRQNHRQTAHHDPTNGSTFYPAPVPPGYGGDSSNHHNQGDDRFGRNWSYSDRQHLISEAGGGRGSGSSGGGGDGAGARARSASEDAVWDMLPSDESECRRPFSLSAVNCGRG